MLVLCMPCNTKVFKVHVTFPNDIRSIKPELVTPRRTTATARSNERCTVSHQLRAANSKGTLWYRLSSYLSWPRLSLLRICSLQLRPWHAFQDTCAVEDNLISLLPKVCSCVPEIQRVFPLTLCAIQIYLLNYLLTTQLLVCTNCV